MKKILFLLLVTIASYGQTYQNPTFGTTKTMTTPTVTTTPHLGTVETNGVNAKITPENLPLSTATTNALELKANKDTGLLSGGIISINSDPTKWDLAAGQGYITNSLTGIVTPVSWVSQSALTTPYLASSVATYVLIDSSGSTVMQNSAPTQQQYRTHIYLGKLAHTTFTTILFAVSEPSRMFDVSGQVSDLNRFLGSGNVDGNIITYNGANLNINASAGMTYRAGANYATDRNSPSITTEPAFTAGTFRNKFRNGSGGWNAVNTTTVDNGHWDNGSGILQVVPNNKWTVMVFWRFGGTGTIHCDYGQVVYDNKVDALAAAGRAAVSEDPETKRDASRRAWLVVQQGVTVLNDLTKAEFIPADKLGERSAGSSSIGTLQTAYNNSTIPQITTTTALGAVTVQEGTGNDANNILVGKNNSGTTTYSVTGAGNVTGGTYNGYTPENSVNKATDFTTVNNTLYPSVQAVKAELDLKANDSDVIHKTGNETKTGSLSVMGTTSPISLIGNSINNTGVSASSDNGLPLSVSTTTSAKLASFIYNASEKSSINSSGGYVINGVTSTNALLAGGGNLANPISGTGTTNRVGVWTSASTQGNSSISQDGSGNITISGGSGADVLNLVKSTGASISLSGSTGTINAVKIVADNATNPDLYFFVGGLERGRFSSSGGFNVSGGITATTYSGGATLTGTPTAPTAAPGSTGTQIANLDFGFANFIALSGNQTLTGRKTLTSDNTTAGGLTVTNSKTSTSTYGDNYGIYVSNSGTGGVLINNNSASNSGIEVANYAGNGVRLNSFATTDPLLILRTQSGTSDLFSAELGKVRITSAGDLRADTFVSNGKIRLKNYTVATLPAGTQGDTAYVTDALAPTSGAVVVGGGAVVCPVFYDGTNWIRF